MTAELTHTVVTHGGRRLLAGTAGTITITPSGRILFRPRVGDGVVILRSCEDYTLAREPAPPPDTVHPLAVGDVVTLRRPTHQQPPKAASPPPAAVVAPSWSSVVRGPAAQPWLAPPIETVGTPAPSWPIPWAVLGFLAAGILASLVWGMA